MAPTRKKIMIVADDHPLVRDALARLLAGLHSHITLYHAHEPGELLKIAARRQQQGEEFTLVDVAPSAAAATPADSPLMVVTTRETGITARWFVPLAADAASPPDDAAIQAALSRREAVQQLIADLATVPGAAPADAIPAGGPPSPEALAALGLTPRQVDVLRLLAEGLSNKEIARRLDVSEWTVRHHVSAIFERLEVSNRTRAANIALSLGQA